MPAGPRGLPVRHFDIPVHKGNSGCHPVGARQRITVIALTDGGARTLLKHTDQRILSFTDSNSVLSSTTALVATVQALATEVAAAKPEQTRKMLEREERMLQDCNVYAG